MIEMHVGFTGTQKGMSPMQKRCVHDILLNLDPVEVHHGDCIGADSNFHDIVQNLMVFINVHPPKNNSKRAFKDGHHTHTPKDYMARNYDIVNMCRTLIATPKGPEELRSGTWATIRYAIKQGREIFIYFPDGSLKHYESRGLF